MKKGGALLRGVSFLLFLALATYVSATLYRQWRHPFLTAPVEEAALEDACYCRVYLARRENSLTLTGLYGFEAREGEKVAKGATLAGIYDSEAAQVRAESRRQLSRRMEALRALSLAESPKKAVYGELTNLHRALRQGDGDALRQATLGLEALFLTGDDPADSEDRVREEMEELQQKIDELEEVSREDTQAVTALEAGIFSRASDGFEHISPEALEGIGPTRLIALYAAADEPGDARLVTGLSWTCAAILPAETAASLTLGQEVSVRFNSVSGSYTLTVADLTGPEENGERVVLFRSDKELHKLLYLRRDIARICFQREECFSVPPEALQKDPETGADILYIVSGGRARAVPVELLSTQGDRVYLRSNSRLLTGGALVITKGDDLYDGKVIPDT